MGFDFMKNGIVRYNLDKVYQFDEYNKTVAYAEKNIEVKGVREQLEKLMSEKDAYIQGIKSITEPEKENENKMYTKWENWNKKKRICIWTSLGLAVVAGIGFLSIGRLPEILSILLILFGYSIILTIPAAIVMKVGESICENAYNNYTRQIAGNITNKNYNFAENARQYYMSIDDLYLRSLDPAHREMVIMRREQAKQHEEMMRVERENLQAQKRLLQIEEERERRYQNAIKEAQKNKF